jgi:hypothetical protein
VSRLWRFGPSKTPGFGIAKGFYLSVLAGQASLPPISRVVSPKGNDGAVVGYGAPLAGATDKTALDRPMERGAYAIASLDRKTVIKTLALPREEAGFDPEPLLSAGGALGLPPATVERIRSTWWLVQLTFESHDPMVYAALDLLLDVAARLARLTEGVIADPISRRYLLPNEVRAPNAPAGPIDGRNFVAVQVLDEGEGGHVITLGLSKFALPEFEIYRVGERLLAERFLLGIAQGVLGGRPLAPGAQIGHRSAPFSVQVGGLDRGLWQGQACLELLPASGRDADECLRAWAADPT